MEGSKLYISRPEQMARSAAKLRRCVQANRGARLSVYEAMDVIRLIDELAEAAFGNDASPGLGNNRDGLIPPVGERLD